MVKKRKRADRPPADADGHRRSPTAAQQKNKKIMTTTTTKKKKTSNGGIGVSGASNAGETWSKSKKKRMRRLKAKQGQGQQQQHGRQMNKPTTEPSSSPPPPTTEPSSSPPPPKPLHHHRGGNDDNNSGGGDEAPPPQQLHRNSKTNNVNINKTTKKKMKSSLQQSFLDRLSGSRFRELNEELYTTTSASSLERFTSRPELFEQYHKGFRTQVQSWPVNPVDVILRQIVSLQRQRNQRQREQRRRQHDRAEGNGASGSAAEAAAAGRDSSNKLVLADFGCGDAKLAKELLSIRRSQNDDAGGGGDNDAKQKKKKDKQKKAKRKKEEDATSADDIGGTTTNDDDCPYMVHSFDLTSGGNPLVTPCDMARVPLENETVDVGVYSLALMGTNMADFIREGWRVLRPEGVLKVAEVRSRFESTAADRHDGNNDGNNHDDNNDNGDDRRATTKRRKRGGGADDRLLREFLSVMEECGFRCTKKDRSNKMFILMEFEKIPGVTPSGEAAFTAKPCIYKRR